MKLWHFAAILLVLGIGYVLISRPTIPSVSANQQANVSNSIWSGIIGGGINAVSKYLGKASPNSAVPPNPTNNPDFNVDKVIGSDADYANTDSIGG